MTIRTVVALGALLAVTSAVPVGVTEPAQRVGLYPDRSHRFLYGIGGDS